MFDALAFIRTRFSKLSSDKACRRGVLMNVANENILSTGADEGRVVLYFKNNLLIMGYFLSISMSVCESCIYCECFQSGDDLLP